ncbi:pilus assembly protein [Roseateles sp. BYS180W]|uniref:Pilus assembly protein n=1 Tax=Roseateles rivi TaxID=3299028 RepID=A0ABW7FRD4_9BURK
MKSPRISPWLGCVAALGAGLSLGAAAQTALADGPVFTSVKVPGNVALALSVEWPTALSPAYPAALGGYNPDNEYIGYFDANKCYRYNWGGDANSADNYFDPAGQANKHRCAGKWSGNFLNWATMHTIDPFRQALTGGARVRQDSITLLQRAWASGQGGGKTSWTTNGVAEATPFDASGIRVQSGGLGFKFRFSFTNAAINTAVAYNGSTTAANQSYEAFVRVRVCNPADNAGGLERNCVRYPSGDYRPEGLIQEYSDRMRFSAFGYLNDSRLARDGGVLRASQRFVGPNHPVPGGVVQANALAEWSAFDGKIVSNPSPADVATTQANFGVTVSSSGVINYLNMFGMLNTGNYKSFDPVSELYYAVLRYFRNVGNVAAWTDMGGQSAATKAAWLDGFPAQRQWDDPIQYACQRNFVLGIGDVNTHADRNLPGATGSNEPSKPSEVASDRYWDDRTQAFVPLNAVAWTNKVGALQGYTGTTLGERSPLGCCNGNGALIAGLAYYANTMDLRPSKKPDGSADNVAKSKGRQSLQTYWIDVMENGSLKSATGNHQFYAAAKYGGFNVPDGFDPLARSTDIPPEWWRTTTELLPLTNDPKPDTFFVASRADLMVKSLHDAFERMSLAMKAYTTSFSLSAPQVTQSGTASYSTQYDAENWSSELSASSLSFDPQSGAPTNAFRWNFSEQLNALTTADAGRGWDTRRRLFSYNPQRRQGVPLRLNQLSSAQQAALDTSARAGNDAADFLNYLRGDRSKEASRLPSTDNAGGYRNRNKLLGDVVNAKIRVVGPPQAPYDNTANPGYSQFRATWAGRKTVVYVASNGGMLHAIQGDLDVANGGGRELFAYLPSAVFNGPSNTPQIDGLAALARTDYTHRAYVDATPVAVDLDLANTVSGGRSSGDWRTLLVGGLGKGGRSIYALDITNPTAISSEADAAALALWEFTDPDLGYTYGEPLVVKTKAHGWVVLLGSGHNNPDGQGYLYVLDARTGGLLKKIQATTTGNTHVVGTPAAPAAISAVQAYLPDFGSREAETAYVGDLKGNLWRFDLTDADGDYPSPVHLAALEDQDGRPLPVTSRPLVVLLPGSNRRYVTVGTGKLLDPSDMNSTQQQRFFAIFDGYGSYYVKEDELPQGMSYPLRPRDLRHLSDLTQKHIFNDATERGWYIDLDSFGQGSGWRLVSDPVSFFGAVAFAPMMPSTADVCQPSGSSRVFAIELGSGQTALLSGASRVPYASVDSVVTDLHFLSVEGLATLIVGNDQGRTGTISGTFNETPPLRRLNWRQVPLPN